MQGADHESVQLLLLELVDRDRTRATGDVVPPAPPYLLLSHGEEFEERVRLASEAAARFDLYIELLCLEAVDRVVVEYFDVSVGWVQQQQQQQLEQHEQFERQQQQQLEQQQQQRRERLRVVDEPSCEQLQRRFLLEQATATAMEQVRKRDRERPAERRAEEVKQRRKERDRKQRAEVHAVRSCCSAPCCARGSGGWRVGV
jgi:septal ring factor EnvC (AmiA/AmiB activator)